MSLIKSKKFWPAVSAASTYFFFVFAALVFLPDPISVIGKLLAIVCIVIPSIGFFLERIGIKDVFWKWWEEDVSITIHKHISALVWGAVSAFIVPAYFRFSSSKNAPVQ